MNLLLFSVLSSLIASRAISDLEKDSGGSRNSLDPSRPNGRSFEDLIASSRTGSHTNEGLDTSRGFNSSSSESDELTDTLSDLVSVGSSSGFSSYMDYFPQGFGSMSFQEALTSFLSSMTGADLTNAQKGMNAFNHDEAVLQRQWETDMSNTAYQRGVADMQAAGINPALMYGNGAASSTPSGAAASGSSSSVSGALLDFVSNIIGQKMQMKMAKMQNENALKIADIQRDSALGVAEINANVGEHANEIRADEVQAIKDNFRKQAEKIDAEIKTEETKQLLNSAVQKFNEASAKQIEELLPYDKKLREATTAKERAIARLNSVNAMIQQGLYDNGLVSKTLEKMDNEILLAAEQYKKTHSDIEVNEVMNQWNRFKKSCKDGSIFHLELTDKESGFLSVLEDYVNTVGAEGLFGLTGSLIENGIGKVVGLGGALSFGRKVTTSTKPFYDTQTGSVGHTYTHQW